MVAFIAKMQGIPAILNETGNQTTTQKTPTSTQHATEKIGSISIFLLDSC